MRSCLRVLVANVWLLAWALILVTSLSIATPVVRRAEAACATPPSNMVAWWRGEGNANDTAGGNNGSLLGGTTFAAATVDQGFNLNGSSSLVSVPDRASLSVTGSFTVDAWIFLRAYSSEFAPVVSKWNDISGNFRSYFMAVNAAHQLEAQISTNGLWNPGVGANAVVLMSGATTVPLNTFVHVAVTFESSSRALILYINGTQVASATSLFSTIFDNTEPLLIGAGDLGSNVRDFFNGIVDEVEVHSRALSQSELASIVAAGNDGKCLGTAGERRAQVNVGGAVGAIAAAAGQQASENRQRAAAAAVASQPVVQAPSTGTGVTPPNTGDGGLLAPTGKRHDAYWFTLAATIFGLALVSWRVVRGT